MLHTSDFDFELPTELIASHPLARRDASRMLVVKGSHPLELSDRHIRDFLDYIQAGDVVVFNNSRVIPARFDATDAAGHEYEITLHTAAGGDVEHVQHQQQRPASLLQLQQQPEGQAQIGGIGDAQHQIGRRFIGEAAKHHIAGDVFVRAAAAQRIGAGQVDQRDVPAGRGGEGAGFALDRDARVIGDPLPASGQGIE